jgi:SAM-dependent methyltransferase
VDPSRAMIGHAARCEQVDYVVATAERLPARASSFDVITLCQVVHWLDWTAFLEEARRVARPEGWVIVYDHYFDLDGPDANPRLGTWLREAYYERYPRPVRHTVPIERSETWAAGGFELLGQDRFATHVTWSPEDLVDYLTTQSNVVAAVEDRGEPIESVRQWLREETSDLFAGQEGQTFAFSGPIVRARRQESAA